MIHLPERFERLGLFLGSALLLWVLSSCETTEKSSEAAEVQGTVNRTEQGDPNETHSFSIPVLPSDRWQRIFSLQQQIMIDSTNLELRKAYCDSVYFPRNEAIVTVGVARLTHPASGENLRTTLVKKAALTDALRWASYASTWLSNDYQPPVGHIAVLAPFPVEFEEESIRGDSLYIQATVRYRPVLQ